jgi:coenzyme F420 biosynthesis associated uncharacterized protein
LSPAAGLVDWGLAQRTAEVVGGGVGPLASSAAGPVDRYRAAEVAAECEAAIGCAAARAGLGAVTDPPRAELVDRGAWARVALRGLAEAAGPVEDRVAGELDGAGPLAPLARRALGTAAGAEAGLAVGYAGRRVLGQYDVALFGRERPPRLLFVGVNLDSARRQLAADRGLFLSWIALHEATHVVQFDRVRWLAEHVRGLAAELIEAAVAGLGELGAGALARALVRAPRELIRAAAHGGLARALVDDDQRRVLDRLQATMSVIEGHAEHVMDAAAPDHPGLAELRRRLDRRRARRSGLGILLDRLLGFDLKLRQYELGKAFCDGAVEQGGLEALQLVWRSPAHLPSLAELERPRAWLGRVTELTPEPA